MTIAFFANASGTRLRQTPSMLGSKDILQELERRGVKKTAIAETLNLDPSRVTELYGIVNGKGKGKPRRLLHDEAVKLVAEFGLEQGPELKPVPPAIVRLVARHIVSELGLSLEPDDPTVLELVADLQAFSRFVADPQVRESIEAAEGFFRGMQLRRSTAPTDPKETDPQPVR